MYSARQFLAILFLSTTLPACATWTDPFLAEVAKAPRVGGTTQSDIAYIVEKYFPSDMSIEAALDALKQKGFKTYPHTGKNVQLTGLLVIAVYAALGFDSLTHYVVAPFAAHTAMMHVTIWLEAATAALLLIAAARLVLIRFQTRSNGSSKSAA